MAIAPRPESWATQVNPITVSVSPDAGLYISGIDVVDGLVTKIHVASIAEPVLDETIDDGLDMFASADEAQEITRYITDQE